MIDRREVYEDLKKVYLSHMGTEAERAAYCPSKSVTALKRNEAGIVTVSVNDMVASDKEGRKVHKVITVDDEKQRTTETIHYEDGKGRSIRFLNCNLTPLRCALMSCLAVELLLGYKPEKVGYIGTGKTNLETCKAVTELFGQHSAVIRGSSRNRAKNKEMFDEVCRTVSLDDTERLEKLSACDVVFTCTSTCDPQDAIESPLMDDVPLIVALDSGYLLGESFRKNRGLYTDHPEQLLAHYSDEFPYDRVAHPHKNLTDAREDGKIAVHLFGVAIADLVVAKHFSGARRKMNGW